MLNSSGPGWRVRAWRWTRALGGHRSRQGTRFPVYGFSGGAFWVMRTWVRGVCWMPDTTGLRRLPSLQSSDTYLALKTRTSNRRNNGQKKCETSFLLLVFSCRFVIFLNDLGKMLWHLWSGRRGLNRCVLEVF